MSEPAPADPRDLLNGVVPMPPCQIAEHATWRIDTNGTYDTLAGPRQRYRCSNPKNSKECHTFSAPLPRALVGDDTCCADCQVPTPRHAGTEAATRRLNYPAPVIYAALVDLSEGRAYTHTSMRVLERLGRPTGRSRMVKGLAPADLNDAGPSSPDREQKAHWHIAADILERFAPLVTEPALDAIRAQEQADRDEGLPVVYFADEVPVKRNYKRTSKRSSPVVWNALVVSRVHWARGQDGSLVGRSSRLVRVRGLPTLTKDAWALVLSELDAPDFLIADGAAAIKKAADTTWGRKTTFVPCVWHALENIRKRLTPRGAELDQKVRDHLFTLTREAMTQNGPASVSDWFDELSDTTAAADLPLDTVKALREQYLPLLQSSARIAAAHTSPSVPISNASVENQIATWVERLVARRGAMFSNIARTNLLGDLITAGANGALLDTHTVTALIRDDARTHDGWSPPPRALVEPAGAWSLRDPGIIADLAAQGTR